VPSPVAHSLAGAAVWSAKSTGRRWTGLAVALVAANLPDIDFLPGLASGNVNLYHHGPTHTLVALVAVCLAAYGVAVALHERPGPWVWLVGLAYGSHLLLDIFTLDTRAPFGIPLFWPLSNLHVASPVTPFLDVQRAADPDRFWASLISAHNLRAVCRELLILGLPLLVLLIGRTRRRRQLQLERLRFFHRICVF